MRAILCGLLSILGASAASAETWQTREGSCGQWRARWAVQQEAEGVWVGIVDHVQAGGPCTPATNERARSQVKAIISGESFFAARQQEAGLVCAYYGRIRDDRVRGFELCEGNAERMAFALRFPSNGTPRSRERGQDDFVDDSFDEPRSADQSWPGPDPDLDFDRPRRR